MHNGPSPRCIAHHSASRQVQLYMLTGRAYLAYGASHNDCAPLISSLRLTPPPPSLDQLANPTIPWYQPHHRQQYRLVTSPPKCFHLVAPKKSQALGSSWCEHHPDSQWIATPRYDSVRPTAAFPRLRGDECAMDHVKIEKKKKKTAKLNPEIDSRMPVDADYGPRCCKSRRVNRQCVTSPSLADSISERPHIHVRICVDRSLECEESLSDFSNGRGFHNLCDRISLLKFSLRCALPMVVFHC